MQHVLPQQPGHGLYSAESWCNPPLHVQLELWRSLTHIWSSGVTQAGLVLHVGAEFIHAACLQDAPDLCGGWSRA